VTTNRVLFSPASAWITGSMTGNPGEMVSNVYWVTKTIQPGTTRGRSRNPMKRDITER
jgi:hypothetical protein